MKKARIRFFQLSLFHLTASLACSSVFAESELMDLSLEDLGKVRVTSSTLTDETLRSVPAAVSVYTRDDIRRLGLSTLNELINLVPGYQDYRTDDFSQNHAFSSRGRNLGTESQEVLILIDGQRVNEDRGGGTSGLDELIPLDNVERVEFIHGPGSSLYGSNALTGVINIITHSERELSISYGSHRSEEGSAQWHAQGELGQLNLFARGTRSDGELIPLFDPNNQFTPTQITRDPHRNQDFYIQTETGPLSFNYRCANRSESGYYVSGFVSEGSNKRQTQSESWNLGWHTDITTDVTLQGHLFQSRKILDIATQLTAQQLVGAYLNEYEIGSLWTLQKQTGKARWLLGWEWRRPELINSSLFFGTPTSPYETVQRNAGANESARYIVGWFGQYQYELSTALALIASLRHDSYSDTGDHLSPRLGMVWTISESDTAKLLYSDAFRAPNRGETAANNAGFLGNPHLDPETAKTTELVWQHFSSYGEFSGTLFNTLLKDAITVAVTPELQRTWVNDNDTLAGVELEWQSQFATHWRTRLALSHLFDNIGPLHTQSDTLFGGSLSYQQQQWTAALLANYQSDMVDPNEQDTPPNIMTTESTAFGGRTIWGAHLSNQIRPDLELYLHGSNLFDRQYNSPANNPLNLRGAPGERRLLMAGVRWML